jgi:hypothetical protein
MGAEDAADCVLRELNDPNINLREVGYSAALMHFTTKTANLELGSRPVTPTDESDVCLWSRAGITPKHVRELAELTGGGT